MHVMGISWDNKSCESGTTLDVTCNIYQIGCKAKSFDAIAPPSTAFNYMLFIISYYSLSLVTEADIIAIAEQIAAVHFKDSLNFAEI